MIHRLLVVAAVLTAGAAGIGWVSRPEKVPVRRPLRELPLAMDAWEGRDNQEFDAKTLAVLGVDDYITRSYRRRDERPASLYVGYYASQRTGQSIHSPMNCLPGSGWQPLDTSVTRMEISEGARPIAINRYLVQNGLQRHIVLFWYQMHGRVVASEYVTKFLLMKDAVQLNRTDGALVRVIVPILDREGEAPADEVAVGFVRALFPRLTLHLPE